MNGLDIALLVVLIFFFLRGIFRGFVVELASIAGLVVGFFLASNYYPAAGDTLKPFIQNQSYRHAVGFEIVFLVAYSLVSFLGIFLNKLVKIAISNVASGLLGATIGLGKGLALSAVVLMATASFIRPDTPFFKDSLSWPYMRNISDGIKEMVPPDLKKSLESKIETLPEPLKPKLPDLSPGTKTDPAPWKPVTPEQSGQPKPGWPSKTNP